MQCQKRTDCTHGNPIIGELFHSTQWRIHSDRLRKSRPQIDTAVPLSTVYSRGLPKDYPYQQNKKKEAAYQNYKMLQSIAKTMTRVPQLPERIKGCPPSLNRHARQKELFRIMGENQRLLHRLETCKSVYSVQKLKEERKVQLKYRFNCSYACRRQKMGSGACGTLPPLDASKRFRGFHSSRAKAQSSPSQSHAYPGSAVHSPGSKSCPVLPPIEAQDSSAEPPPPAAAAATESDFPPPPEEIDGEDGGLPDPYGPDFVTPSNESPVPSSASLTGRGRSSRVSRGSKSSNGRPPTSSVAGGGKGERGLAKDSAGGGERESDDAEAVLAAMPPPPDRPPGRRGGPSHLRVETGDEGRGPVPLRATEEGARLAPQKQRKAGEKKAKQRVKEEHWKDKQLAALLNELDGANPYYEEVSVGEGESRAQGVLQRAQLEKEHERSRLMQSQDRPHMAGKRMPRR
ncbi:unnamed protein product [Vitrella brassicaformis CCMP3155]|uniref:Uncharacterized protein n=1 Tax=Vitrella brassicaformis (strain CCMP3155) TaxID=1169540 RepID=A0A0G4FAH1_VITBC|nr:unnamed protein product [Vitrella brassicaformis CCMP3155]|eukprot:CEM09922.1 unnamed protein product [Vitrella brassicaformis CCMP3155]